jgi:hypothetical protein
LDALDECSRDSERQAWYAAASQAFEAGIRPVARSAVTPVRVLSADPLRYQTGFSISVVAGPEFLVTEVSCGCRQQYYLDLHSLIAQAATPRGPGGLRGRVHVPPLPTDMPERERQRVLESFHSARRESPSP